MQTMLDGGATADTKIDSRGAKEIIDILPKEEVSTYVCTGRFAFFSTTFLCNVSL